MSNMGEHLKLSGTWVSVSATNVEPFMEKVGAPFPIKKAAGLLKPTQKVSFDGMKMKLLTSGLIPLITKENNVLLDGTEFTDEMFGNTLVATATINEDGSITINGKLENMEMQAIRKLNAEGQMVLTMIVDNIECVRTFARKE